MKRVGVIILSLFTKIFFAQPYFQLNYPSNIGIAMRADETINKNNYFFIGFNVSSATTRAVLARTNKNGIVNMQRAFRSAGSNTHTLAYSGQQTLDSGYVMLGVDRGGFVLGRNVLFVIKTQPNGQLQWSKTYDINIAPSSLNEGGINLPSIRPSIQQTTDNGFVFSAVYNLSGTRSAFIFKTDAAGILQWSRSFTGFDFGGIVSQTADNGYILCGNSVAAGQKDVVLIKLNATGNTLWSSRYGSPTLNEFPQSIKQTANKGFVVVGNSQNTTLNRRNIFLFTTDSVGAPLWDKELGFSTVDEFGCDVIEEPGGDLVIGGYINDSTTFSGVRYDTYVAKLNSSGSIYWQRKIGNGAEQRGNSLKKVSGGYLLSGLDGIVPGMIALNNNGLTNGCNDNTTILPQTNSFIQGAFNTINSIQTNNIIEINQTANTLTTGAGLYRDIVCIKNCPLQITPPTSLCIGYSAVISVAGGSQSYTWENDPSLNTSFGNIVIATPSSTTTYTVTEGDCNSQAITTVSVVPIPIVSVTGDSAVCQGSTAQLSALGAVSYYWQPALGLSSTTGSNQIINTSSSTTYTVYGTSGLGCWDTTTVTIVVNSLPTIAVSPNSTICLGTQTAITAGGATSYSWSNGSLGSSIFVSPSNTTTYSVTGTDLNGCKNSAVSTVSVNASPVAIISGSTSICVGSATTLSGSGGSNFLWSTGATSASISVSPTGSTSYSLAVVNSFGCADTTSILVATSPLPIVSVPTTTVCSGTTANISAIGSATNNYQWSSGLGNGQLVSATPTNNTTYTVIATAPGGCSNSATATVIVNSLPQLLISPNTIICNGDQAKLTASGAVSYVWSNAGTNTFITVTPTANTNYTVTGIGANGCSNTASSTVFVSSAPVAIITGTQSICVGGTTVLTASGGTGYVWNNSSTANMLNVSPNTTTTYSVIASIGSCYDTTSFTVVVDPLPQVIVSADTSICIGNSVVLQVSGSATNYLWSPLASTASTIQVSPTSTTTYSVTATDNKGCTMREHVTVTVNTLPIVSVSSNTTICLGASATLTSSGGINYSWSNSSTTTSINVSPLVSTNYSVSITDINGCSSAAMVRVNVIEPPEPFVSNDTSVCEAQPIVLVASGGTSYSWNTGELTAAIMFNATMGLKKYVVNVSNGVCASKDSVIVNVFALPTADAGANVLINKGASTTLMATGGIGYIWSPSEGLSCINCSDPIANPTETTTYYVTVINEAGCSSRDSVTVEVEWICKDLFIPNAFSPNGDGQNDVFKVYGNCVKEVYIAIYNQWGERVFEASGESPEWNGVYKDILLNTDVFAYSARVLLITGEAINKTGNVSLIR